MAKHKIWWQSSTRDGGFPAYRDAILAHGKKYLSPDFEVEMHGVPFGSSELGYMSVALMNEHQVMHNMLKLRGTDVSAVAFGCFQDPTLKQTREILDIPVVGMGQTSLLWAQMYGNRPCIVTYERLAANKFIPELIEANGLGGRMCETVFFDLSLEALGASFDDPSGPIEDFLRAGKRAVDMGADVILPGCGLLNLILADNGVNCIPGTGVPIMDVTAVLMKTAEAAIILHELNGFKVSRSGYFEAPSDELINAVRDIYYGC